MVSRGSFRKRQHVYPTLAFLGYRLVRQALRPLSGQPRRVKQPKDTRFLDHEAFPRNISGKVLRHELEVLLDS
jgi:hypothetical protein